MNIENDTCIVRGCTNLVSTRAILAGIQGCRVECETHIEKRMGASIETLLKSTLSPRKYPTTGRISEDDPSIWGSAVLGHEGELWSTFAARHAPDVTPECAEPYRRGIGQGFGSTEDGEENGNETP